jgi:hypothetical protein
MRLDYSGTKIIQILIVTIPTDSVILDHVVYYYIVYEHHKQKIKMAIMLYVSPIYVVIRRINDFPNILLILHTMSGFHGPLTTITPNNFHQLSFECRLLAITFLVISIFFYRVIKKDCLSWQYN